MATIAKYRTLLLLGIGVGVLLLLMFDRARLITRHEKAQVEAKEDALRRQTAVVNHNRATLVAGIVDKLSEDSNSLENALFIVSTDILHSLWNREKEIDQAQFERATVSAKRLLDALDCKSADAFFDAAKKKLDNIAEKKGLADVTDEHLIGFLGLDSSEEFDQFRTFISRACDDIVVNGNDVESKMQNAPDGVFRLF